MGQLSVFNLGEMLTEFQADTFFETGTGRGEGVRYAQRFPFKRIYSVEIVESILEERRRDFQADPRVHLVPGQSAAAMRQVLPQIDGNIIFWLDAHYPGADFKLAGYDSEQNLGIRLPLEQELLTIKELRPAKRDLILIDDLRIYENDQFEMGNLKDQGMSHIMGKSSAFLYTIFQQTHDVERYLNDSGYLLLIPKPLR